MAHKYEHISTGAGFKVSNDGTDTTVITQAGKAGTDVVTTSGITDLAVTNAKLGKPKLTTIQETVAFGDFTDGGAAVGTFELSTDIPVGAYVVQASIDDVTGFAGDTTCTLTIGDGTDVDRYNTGTPNIFATATAIDAGGVSGTSFHSAAKTPTLTATAGSDWGAVTAGSVTVTIFYYEAV